MSNEYIAPPVVLTLLTGTGVRVSNRRARSEPASPFLFAPFPTPLFVPPFPLFVPPFPTPLFPVLFAGGAVFCAYPGDRTSKEATNTMPRNLPYRAIGTHNDVSKHLDIFPPSSVFL